MYIHIYVANLNDSASEIKTFSFFLRLSDGGQKLMILCSLCQCFYYIFVLTLLLNTVFGEQIDNID